MQFIKSFLQKVKATKLKRPSSIFYYIQFTHGLRCYPNESRIYMILRFIIASINAAFCAYILQIAFSRLHDQPVLTRINSSFHVSGVLFPAVAVCNENVISLKESVFIKNILKHHGKSDLEIESFLESLQELVHYGPSVTDVEHHTEIMDILKHYHFNIDSIMYLLHQKCEDLILYCTYNGIRKGCQESFDLHKTSAGYCCVYNRHSNHNSPFDITLIKENDHDTHLKESPDIRYYFTTQSGWGSGLRILLNIEPSSYPSWSNARFYGAKILLFGTDDYAEYNMAVSRVSMHETVGLDVETIAYNGHVNLRYALLEQRECWFTYEANNLRQQGYSLENCLTECMMNYYIHICGCLPYKYPRFDEATKYCELSDLKCLNNVTARIDPDCECECECEDQHYNNGFSELPFISSLFPADIIKNYNTSELSELQVFFADSTCKSYQKFLLADQNNKLSVYGGIISLFFGSSFMSLFELVYLIAAYSLAIAVKVVAWIYVKIIN